MSKSLLRSKRGTDLAAADILDAFGPFRRLRTAEGDASPATIRTYDSQAGQFVAWCQAHGANPATATEDDVVAHRKHLVDADYTRATVALKLVGVRRLYEAAPWRGSRQDSPAAGVKAPKQRRARHERVKFRFLSNIGDFCALKGPGTHAMFATLAGPATRREDCATSSEKSQTVSGHVLTAFS